MIPATAGSSRVTDGTEPPTKKRFVPLASAGLILLLAGGALSPAWADRVSRIDADDIRHRLDIRRIVHTHGDDPDRVRHKMVSYETWRARTLRKNGWRVSFFFSIDKNRHDAERRIVVRRRDGKLHAAFFAGPHATKRRDADIRVRRPDRRTVVISFEADILRAGLASYRWWAGVHEASRHAQIPEAPPRADFAPRSSIRHALD